MKARVLAEGQFHGQVVKVLRQDGRGNYRLATMWNEHLPYPAWFGPDEVEIIEDEEAEREEKR